MKTKLFILVLFFSTLCACKKEFLVNYPDLPPTLVINCLFTNDSIFNIQITKLQYMNDTTNAVVENAEVILYENDTFFEHIPFNTISKTYKSEKTAKVGRTYRVTANVSGFPVTTATDKMPNTISIDSVNVHVSAYYDSWEQYKLDVVELYFEDTATENYYEVISYEEKTYTDSYDNTQFYIGKLPAFITSLDPVILAEGILDEKKYQPVLIFSDKLLAKKAKITFMPFLQLGTTSPQMPAYTLLRNVSKKYYLFRKQWYKYLLASEPVSMNGIAQLSNMSFISNPTEAYTNIENGLGIFAAYTETSKLMTGTN